MRTIIMLAALCGFVTGTVSAADPVKLDEFKLKAQSGEAGELIGLNADDGKIFFYINGSATAEVDVKDDGKYKLTIEASCDEAAKEKARIKITVGGKVIEEKFDLTEADKKSYEFKVDVKKGKTAITIEFINDKYKENEYDLNFYLHSVKLEK